MCVSDNTESGKVGSIYTKLNRYREEVKTSSLGDGISALNARKVDVAGLYDTLLALGGLDDLLGEAVGD
jgi:hypothetical protein